MTTSAEAVRKQLSYSKAVALGSGEYVFRFSLWTGETAGSGDQVWSEEQTLVLSTPSINTVLGKVASLSIVDFSRQLWVQAEQKTDTGYTVLGPRDILRAMPYALWSDTANALRHRMYPENPIVYQDIFDAKAAGAIVKLGNPAGYDDKTYSTNLWGDRRIISFGNNNEADGSGAVVIIPDGYTTVWLRVLGERWNAVKAYFTDGSGEQLGLWTGGYRSTNCYCPDGSLTDSYKDAHQWMPIPAGRSGRLALISKPNTSGGFWLSGLAFSKNPWAHAVQSAVSYHWILNGGDATEWANGWENWNTDSLTKITAKKNLLLRVPVIPSKKDKLLYLVEHNNNWNGCMHSGITVNKKPIERLLATYDNPFARHWNSKYFERYIAARIPAGLIPDNAKFLDVVIDMSKQNDGIHVREIGTHDLDVPWS